MSLHHAALKWDQLEGKRVKEREREPSPLGQSRVYEGLGFRV